MYDEKCQLLEYQCNGLTGFSNFFRKTNENGSENINQKPFCKTHFDVHMLYKAKPCHRGIRCYTFGRLKYHVEVDLHLRQQHMLQKIAPKLFFG